MTEQRQEVEHKRDHYWWVHPAMRGQQALSLADAGAMPFQWTSSAQPEGEITRTQGGLSDDGPFADFAKLLYKLNACRPGPVAGWYVVVCTEPEKAYAVGQLCADAITPVRLFEDLAFATEDEARLRAAAMRAADPGIGGPLTRNAQ